MPISAAKKDVRVLPLLDEVQQSYRLKYHRSKDLDWWCRVEGKVAHISYQKTAHPGASLAHELLHVVVQHNGYRRIRIGCSTIDRTWRFARLLDCLNNQLQHHKMFARFSQLGFPPAEFYADHAVNTSKYLEEALERTEQNLIEILPDFFTVIAPGGCLTHQERNAFEQRFLQLNSGQYALELTTVKDAITQWAVSPSYDSRPTLRAIFLTMQNPCYTWLRFAEVDRPPDGFFIDKIFDPEKI